MNKDTKMDFERGSMRAIVWPMVIAAIVGAILALAGLTGCQSINLDDPRIQDAFDKAVAAIEKAIDQGKPIPGDTPGNPETPPPSPPTVADPPAVDPPAVATDAVPYSDLNWSHGGFNGSKAVLNPVAVIGNLSVSSGGLSFRWISGNCQTLGASSSGDIDKTLACMFYRDSGGRWQGGKFDWISTSRLTRDFKNVDSGYQGWNAAAFRSASEVAFVVVGLNGRRSNVITARK
jgi:hypothetical protein